MTSVDAVSVPIDTVGAFVDPPRLLVAGAVSGPLVGMTLAVKDLFDVAGTVTGAGNPVFAADRAAATTTAPAVERLVAAGASVVGKTITDELAFSLSGTNVHYGTPRNVAAPGRVPGGSSAGSAAAVAAALVDLALGTDTGGSIRVPASHCGIFGWRPTHGAVPLDGVVPLAPSFDTAGLLANRLDRLLAGATALLGVGGGFDETPPPERILIIEEAIREIDAPLAVALESAVQRFGLPVERVELGVDLADALGVFRVIQGFEAWQGHGRWIESTAPNFGPGIASRFAAASEVTEAEAAEARERRIDIRERIVTAAADDCLLVAPAAPGAAPPIAGDPAQHNTRRMATLRLTCIAGLAGIPAVVAPLLNDDDLPLGVAFMAAPGRDLAILSWLAAQDDAAG